MIFFINSGGSSSEISTGAIIGTAAAIFAVAVAFYVLRAIGLYKLAVKHGIKNPILAWFPFTWFYLAGLLIGNVYLFGKRFDRFALTAFIVFTVSEAFYVGLQLFTYIPVVGYYLQGGTMYFSLSKDYFTGCNAIIGTSTGYLGLVNFIDPYSDAFWKTIEITYYFARILRIVSLFFTVIVYSNFFRCFLPNHYFIATIFSFFGFFGPFAFAVRNNNRVNYVEYMRARYAAFYGMGNGYGGYGAPRPNDNNDGDPFEDVGKDNNNDHDGSEDPFGEFSDDKKD